MFGERDVTVRLKLSVREYIAGGTASDRMNRQLIASQDALGASARKAGDEIDALGVRAERSGRRMNRGLLYGAAGFAALGVAGGGIKALPPLLAATATGAAVLPQVLLGSAAAGGVLKASLSGVGDELKAVIKAQDQFGKPLATNAQAFVGTYARVRPVLQSLQQGLQQNAFASTAAGLELVVSKTLPQVSDGLEEIATDWSHLFAEMALTASSPEFIGMFNTVTATADRFFDQFNNRIRPLNQAISTLITSADPVARAFGDRLMAMVDRFTASVERARQSGSLAEVFESGTEAARELMMISEDVLRITGMVIRESAATNDAGRSAAQSLRAYVESGRAAGDVAGIVNTLTVAWEGLRDVMAPLGELVRDALADPGVAASLQHTFAALAVGSEVLATMMRILLTLNEATGGLLLPLIGIALASGKVTAAITLTTAAATRGAAALTAYGKAGAVAGRGLTGLAAGAGKLIGALFILEAAHQVFAAFDDASADVDKLNASVEQLAKTGEMAGEVSRIFNKGWADMGSQALMATDDNWLANFLRDAEEAIPLAGDLARAVGSPSFVQSAENFAELDASMARYGQTTNDLKGMTEAWNRVSEETGLGQAELQQLLPGTASEMARLQAETHALETGMGNAAARTALLKAPLNEAVTAGRQLLDVFTELNGGAINFGRAQLAAEKAVDTLTAGLKENGLALNRAGTGFDILREKGAANQGMLLDTAEAAAKAAQARLDEGGSVAEAAGVYEQYINRARVALAVMGATPAQIDAIIGAYAEMPDSLKAAGAEITNLNAKLASIPKGTKFKFDGESMIDAQGNALDLGEKLKGLPKGQTFTWNGKNLVDGKGKVVDLQAAIQKLPPAKNTRIQTPGIDPATGKVIGLAEELQGLPDGNASIQVNAASAFNTIRQVRQSLANLGGAIAAIPNRHGGIYTRAAAAGLVEAQVAPPGTLYQWAEPETGGEAFIPRRGNRRRSRAILAEAAEWHGMRVVPMLHGGVAIRSAASGLVNVERAPAPAAPTRATRLDYAESYVQAREAVKGLNAALKENGRSFSTATAKGLENRSALYSAIRAAQDAARTKFEETGNVRLANRAYDEHIVRLRRTLVQQKVNAATIRALMSLAQRPTYDTAAVTPKPPSNSASLITYARSLISAAGGIEDLRDALSLNRPTVGLDSPEGRANLAGILDFLGQAEAAAQARYAHSGSAKLATALYDSYVAQLRQALSGSGYSKTVVDNLIKSYGRITLSKNERGGIHHAAAGLLSLGPDAAGIYPAGPTLYGFAERSTGGEAFIPRNGIDRRRGLELADTAAGWYGGRVVGGAGAAGGGSVSYDYSTHMTVQPQTYNPSMAELLGHQRALEARSRSGRPK